MDIVACSKRNRLKFRNYKRIFGNCPRVVTFFSYCGYISKTDHQTPFDRCHFLLVATVFL
jgi:hypothetical protein